MMKHFSKGVAYVGAGVVVAASVSSNAAAAALDFTALTTAVDVTTVVAAISAIAALKMAPGFARWAYSKVIGWFR